jgi:hypothetical protein
MEKQQYREYREIDCIGLMRMCEIYQKGKLIYRCSKFLVLENKCIDSI